MHALAGGHRYVFVFARAPDALMVPVTLSAVQGSSPVDGAVFELTQSDGVVERLATANGLPHRGEAVAGALQSPGHAAIWLPPRRGAAEPEHLLTNSKYVAEHSCLHGTCLVIGPRVLRCF